MTSMSALSLSTSNYLLKALQLHIEGLERITAASPVSGGDINEAYCLQTNVKPIFLKKNSAGRYRHMFEKEARALQLLKKTGAVRIPQVIGEGEFEAYRFLALEWVESGAKPRDFWENFGHQLAALHRNTHETFGLDHDNYIGSLPQYNKPHRSWGDFMVNQRLEPQFEMAYNAGYFERGVQREVSYLFEKLDGLFPEEPPALLHGDLWGGNYLCDEKGQAVLFDPALYYGHREMDLAMMQLFGGFSQEVFTHYHEAYPLEEAWQQRSDLCNLYPLLVHVNLFGGGYVQQFRHSLRKFI